MIARMKKVNVLFFSEFVERDIEALQDLGLADIDESHKSIDPEDERVRAFNAIEKSINTLTRYEPDGALERKEKDAYVVAQQVNSHNDTIETIRREMEELRGSRVFASRLGEVSCADVEKLAQEGVGIELYKAPPKQKNPFRRHDASSNENNVLPLERAMCVWRSKKESYWAVFSFQKESVEREHGLVLPKTWTSIRFPDISLSAIDKGLEERKDKIQKLERKLQDYAGVKQWLINARTELSDELSRVAVVRNGTEKNAMYVVEGYIPAKAVTKMLRVAVEKGWGITINDPSAEDANVPTKVENMAPVRIIAPMFRFLDVDPGYREYDISFIFLLFMSLFTAMIIGDAGYASILVLVSVFAIGSTLKKRKKITLTHLLCLWFSFTTLLWGAITGNWFGYAPIAQKTALSFFVVSKIAFFNPESKEVIQLFAFRIGIVHLLLAHFWRFLRVLNRRGWMASLHELGQMSMLCGLFFLVLQLILGAEQFPIPPYGLKLILIGFVAILLTAEQSKGVSIFIGMAKGIANGVTHALNAIASFADIISYIRLYAVGLASLAIATSFNAMGQALMETGGFAIVGGMLTIALGHTLNLAMGILAVVVHGVRLNVLEFSGHLGMEWTGRQYTPFRKKTKRERRI